MKSFQIRSVFIAFLLLVLPVSGNVAQAATDAEGGTPKWDSSLSLGLNLTRGNSETSLMTATVESHLKQPRNDLRLKAEWNYGKAETERSDGTKDTEVNVQNMQGAATYRRLLSERAYGYLNLNAIQDEIADIDYRVTTGLGAGYYLLRSDRTELSIEGGLSYIAEEVDGNRDGAFAARLAERFDYQFTETSRVWETVEYLASLRNTENYLLNGELGAEAALTTTLALRVALQAKYDNTPASGKEEYDLVLSSGVTYRF